VGLAMQKLFVFLIFGVILANAHFYVLTPPQRYIRANEEQTPLGNNTVPCATVVSVDYFYQTTPSPGIIFNITLQVLVDYGGGAFTVTLDGTGNSLLTPVTQGIAAGNTLLLQFPTPSIPTYPAYFEVKFTPTNTADGPFYACIDMQTNPGPTSTILPPPTKPSSSVVVAPVFLLVTFLASIMIL